jgi:hypothetical protein
MKLIYENIEGIKQRKIYAEELVNTLNQLLSVYQSKHNHFGQSIDESFVYHLMSQPVEAFDELLIVNSPLKPIPGKTIDAEKLSDLVGIDRKGFIQSFTVLLPGSKNFYNKVGMTALFKLAESDKHVVLWKGGKFEINEKALLAQCEIYKIYAESSEQIAEIEYWENLCETLNKQEKLFIDKSDICRIGILFGLADPSFTEYKFCPDRKKLANKIKSKVLN